MSGQRRKEHLRNLEQAEKERATIQKEEIEKLRRENEALRQENETLQKESTSGLNSPVASSSASSVAGAPGYPRFGIAPPGIVLDQASALHVDAAYPAAATSLIPGPPALIVTPQPVANVRAYLTSLFQPILSGGPLLGQQSHLHSLALMGPNLPQSLRPTELQLHTPHLAAIDLIPSPWLRESLIRAGDLAASNFLAQVCTFVCDIEDHGQITIWGQDALNELSWEFSKEVLEQWGQWILDESWFRRAAFWRKQRGATVPEGWDG